MDDRRPRRTTLAFQPTGTAIGTSPLARDPRAAVVVPVRYRYDNFIDFIESQSVNISRSGVFVNTEEELPIGTQLEFEFSLLDGFVLLKGLAEVVRVSRTPPLGLGLKFLRLEPASQKLIERIVEVNSREGKQPTVSLDFAPLDSGTRLRGLVGATPVSGGVVWKDDTLAIELNTVTVSYFVYNPLLNIRLGGFVVPSDREVSLGTVFAVTLTSMAKDVLFQGKGKVVAKHETRLGIRLTDADKPTLARLQAEIGRLVAK